MPEAASASTKTSLPDHALQSTGRPLSASSVEPIPTQMGNQGHAEEGYRRLCEYLWSGVIGEVRETHSWTNRANGGVGPRPPVEPAPAGMHWDAWIGPAPYREYHSDLHPHEWHGWYDFGNGSIGNMGCHVLDGVFWSLKVEHPDSIEVEQLRGGSDERYPTGSFEYGARLTEFAILGNLAQRAGEGRKLEWDGPNQRVKNLPELNAWVQREYREGWRL